MTRWLVDTNVIAELRKPGCNLQVRAWAESQLPQDIYLSRITIAEIRFGIERAPDAGFRAELVAWLDSTLRPWFADRVLEVDEDVQLIWRRFVARGRAINHTYPQPDLFIAATAELHGLTVVTRNVDDFVHTGVPIYNPWTVT